MKRGRFCGEPVSDKDWDDVGGQRVWICGSAACDKEARDANRAAQEAAQLDAADDGYSRYL